MPRVHTLPPATPRTYTATHRVSAALGNHPAIVRDLLGRGADASAVDNDNDTALACARIQAAKTPGADYSEVIRLLEAAAAPPSDSDSDIDL